VAGRGWRGAANQVVLVVRRVRRRPPRRVQTPSEPAIISAGALGRIPGGWARGGQDDRRAELGGGQDDRRTEVSSGSVGAGGRRAGQLWAEVDESTGRFGDVIGVDADICQQLGRLS
jgi:hypothetical protein